MEIFALAVLLLAEDPELHGHTTAQLGRAWPRVPDHAMLRQERREVLGEGARDACVERLGPAQELVDVELARGPPDDELRALQMAR